MQIPARRAEPRAGVGRQETANLNLIVSKIGPRKPLANSVQARDLGRVIPPGTRWGFAKNSIVPTRNKIGISLAYENRVRSILVLIVALTWLVDLGCANAHNAILSWTPLDSPAVAGYNVYFGTSPGQYPYKISAGNATTLTISNLNAGSTYYFVATTVDTNGVESAFSAPVSFIVPGVIAISAAQSSGNSPLLQFPVEPGHWYEIQATTDFQTWTSICQTTVAVSNEWVYFTDPNAGEFTSRYYRLLQH